MDNRKFIRSVRAGGKVFKPGMEDALCAELSQNQLDQMVSDGVLLGGWKSVKTGSDETNGKYLSKDETMRRFMSGDSSDQVFESLRFHQQAMVVEQNSRYAANDENSESNTQENSLPDDFPQRHIFIDLGFKSLDEVQKLSKEQLMDLKGIGESTADKALIYGK